METIQRLGERTLDCREVEELSDDYIDGDISVDTQQLVECHLQHCQHCTNLISDLEMVIRSAKELALKPIPTAVHDRFREALKKQLGVDIGDDIERKLFLIKGGSPD